MATTNARALVGKLNQTCFKALIEGAAGLCMARTNYHIEVEHFLVKLLELADADLPRILRHYDVNLSTVVRQLTSGLDKLKRGNDRAPGLSVEVLELIREAWLLASVEYHAGKIRSGYLLAAALTSRNLASRIADSSAELAKIDVGIGNGHHGPDLSTESLRAKEAVASDKARAAGLGVRESTLNRNGLPAGTRAPNFSLPDLAGGERTLADYRGRRVLLVFSDPACGPCQALAPELERLHREGEA